MNTCLISCSVAQAGSFWPQIRIKYQKTRTNTFSSKKHEKVKQSQSILRHHSPLLTSRFATRFQHLSSKNKDVSANQRDGNTSCDYSFLSSYFTIHGFNYLACLVCNRKKKRYLQTFNILLREVICKESYRKHNIMFKNLHEQRRNRCSWILF